MYMATIFQKKSQIDFLNISLMGQVCKMLYFNTSVTFMPLDFRSMGFAGEFSFYTVWKDCICIIFEVLIHNYYYDYSSILMFSWQCLLFRENGQFASWVSYYIKVLCTAFFLCYSSNFLCSFIYHFIQCLTKTHD